MLNSLQTCKKMLCVTTDWDNLNYNNSEIKMSLTLNVGQGVAKGNAHLLLGCGNGFIHFTELVGEAVVH